MDLNSRSRSHETANCDKDLLKMGLELLGNLNKSLKLPYAIVKPRIQKGEISEESDVERESSLSPPSMTVNVRKRKHSGEMTEMEKKEKRRMMNRVSAQTARDRKKQYVVELEKKLAQLEDQNKCLVKENEQLKQHTSLLESEKLLLEQKLSQSMPVNRESEMECTTGSAAGAHSFSSPTNMACDQLNLLDLLYQELASSSPQPSCPSPDVEVSPLPNEPSDIRNRTISPQTELVGCTQPWMEPSNEFNLDDLSGLTSDFLEPDLNFLDPVLSVNYSDTTNPEVPKENQASVFISDAEVDKMLSLFEDTYNTSDSTFDINDLISR